VIKRTKWAGRGTRTGEMKNAYRILFGNRQSKRLVEKHKHTWEDIKVDLAEMGCKHVNWIQLAQDRSSDGYL
jgi:hypothetical protein